MRRVLSLCTSCFHPFPMEQQATHVASALLPTTIVFMMFKHIMPAYARLHSQNTTFVASCHFTENKEKKRYAFQRQFIFYLDTEHNSDSCRWRWMGVMPSPSEAAQPVAASGTPRSSQMMKLRRMCAPNSAMLLSQAPLAMRALQVGIHLHFWCTCIYVTA